MMAHVDFLLGLGVVLSTAATRLCDVQCGGVVTAEVAGGYLEQCLVSAIGIRGD
jgi:hypothetical protein